MGADTALDSCEGVTCNEAGTCLIVGGVAQCQCNEGYGQVDGTSCLPHDPNNPCATAQCDAPAGSQCVANASSPDGYDCECGTDHVLVGDQCVSVFCDGDEARSFVTIYDMTPLSGVTNPVRHGFDPLLLGDKVRVVTEVKREAGDAPLRLHLLVENMDIDPESIRLDGQRVAHGEMASTRLLEVDLGAEFVTGRLAFDATIVASGADLIAVDARVFTASRCAITGSASGARIKLAGTSQARSLGCHNMSDLRSIQISEAIPDKDTQIYRQRNGDFTEIVVSEHNGVRTYLKILTQMTLCLERHDGRSVSVSGSADGTRAWTIDNHLLIEVYDGDPSQGGASRVGAYMTSMLGLSTPLTMTDGTAIELIKHGSLPGDLTGSRGSGPFSFPAGVVRLDEMLPVGEQVWLRFTGLDAGIAGHLSRLFLNSSEPDETVVECRSFRDCPRPNTVTGVRSGCIDGRCEALPCANDASCGTGRRCAEGFCTDGCTSDDGCPAGQVCGQSFCVDLNQGGCRSYADCPTGNVCLQGQCQAGCFHPTGQDPTYGLNNVNSVCRQTPDACPRCGPESSTCWYMYCRDCEIDAHCAPGQICADFQCVPAD